MDPTSEKEKIFQEGLQALAARDFRRATRIGKKLLKLHYTGGFEILAKMYAATGRPKQAVKAWQAGLEVAPNLYTLWSGLGVQYSNMGRYDEAIQAFQRAENFGDVSGQPIIDQAVVLNRAGRYAQALSILPLVFQITNVDPETKWTAEVLQLSNMIKLGQFSEVLQLSNLDHEDPDFAAQHRTERAYALAGLNRLDEAKELLAHSADISVRGLWIFRSLFHEVNRESKGWQMLVEGTLSINEEGRKLRGQYVRGFTVKAPSPQVALTYVQRIRFDDDDELKVVKFKKVKSDPSSPDGVYSVQKDVAGFGDFVES